MLVHQLIFRNRLDARIPQKQDNRLPYERALREMKRPRKKSAKKTKAQLAREAKRARDKAWKELSLKLRTERGRCEVCGEPA